MTKEQETARARVEAWIALAEQHERLLGSPRQHKAFIEKHPSAGIFTAQLVRDLVTLSRGPQGTG